MNRLFAVLSCSLLMGGLYTETLAADQIRVLALFANKAMVSVDGVNRFMKVGTPSPEGVHLISADSQSAVIEIDGRRDNYSLGSHIQTSYAKPVSLEARIWRDDTGSYSTRGSINGQSVDMLVDTGATSVAMNANQADSLGICYRSTGQKISLNTASGVTGGYAVSLGRVRVGNIEFRDVDAVVVDGENPPVVLLGMAFLNRVNMENQGSLLTLRTVNP